MPTRGGKKVTQTHSTVIPEAISLVDVAQRDERVKKIVLGRIASMHYAKPRVTFRDESPTCVLAKIRGRNAFQEIRFYLVGPEARDEVVKILETSLRM